MFLSVHSTIGLIIGKYSANPILAFFVGLISHYCCDIIPHGDTKLPKRFNNLVHWSLAGIIDLTIVFINVVLLIYLRKINIYNLNFGAAFLGSVLPDFLLLAYFLTDKKFFIRPFKFHEKIHNLISKKYEFNFYVGLGLQLAAFVILNLIFFYLC
ncbi:MAG: hypothetical protein PHC97_02730 [Patescibacteria group bacterium]|nr:hypothetical protein [Patescibacteria group bacterium]